MKAASLGFAVDTKLGVEAAEALTGEPLKEEGFGVLTEIDTRATLREKLGMGFGPHKILGACNPSLAQRALETDPVVGLLVPCNVGVEEAAGGSRVSFLDPIEALGIVRDEGLRPVAAEAAARLRRVAAALKTGAK